MQLVRFAQAKQFVVGHGTPEEIAETRSEFGVGDPAIGARFGIALNAKQKPRRDQHAGNGKLKALLAIAGKVQQDGKLVTTADVEAARKQGATDLEIHDTVLIAAAFCMYNRYVDGLGTWQPSDPEMYAQMGRHLADEGYQQPSIKQPVEAVAV